MNANKITVMRNLQETARRQKFNQSWHKRESNLRQSDANRERSNHATPVVGFLAKLIYEHCSRGFSARQKLPRV